MPHTLKGDTHTYLYAYMVTLMRTCIPSHVTTHVFVHSYHGRMLASRWRASSSPPVVPTRGHFMGVECVSHF